MDLKTFLKNERTKKALPHIIAVFIFILLSYLYFLPQKDGYKVYQHDNETYIGMSKEIKDHWKKYDEDPLWTNSMFGGMPAYQITLNHSANWVKQMETVVLKIFQYPAALLIVAMISFYIMLMCFRIDPWIAVIGSLAYGFAAFNILYIGAGHITKVHAVGLMPLVIGGMVYTYRREMIIGGVLTSFFLALHLSANHLQETYYLVFLVIAIGIVEFYRHFVGKKMKKFFVATGILVVAAIIGVLPVYYQLKSTSDYSKQTMRAPSDLTIPFPGKEEGSKTKGLDRDYIKEYSLGHGEYMSLIVPKIKGEKTAALGNDKDLMKDVNANYAEQIAGMNQYWGEQNYSGGTFYLGISVFLLFILGMVFIKDPIKWGFLAVIVLSVMLSWKYGSLLDWFIDNVPMYNKFRDTKMMLVLVQVSLPVMGMLFLRRLTFEKVNQRKLMITLGAVLGVFVIMYMSPGTFFDTFSKGEMEMFDKAKENPEQAQLIPGLMSELETVRIGIMRGALGTSLFIMFLVGGLVFLYNKGILKDNLIFIGGIAVIVIVDLWVVDKHYLDNKKVDENGQTQWVKAYDKKNPYDPNKADLEILEKEIAENTEIQTKIDEALQEELKDLEKDANQQREESKIKFRELNFATNYRVYDRYSGITNSARASYFHKSVGGYHGAKLQRFNDIIAFCFPGRPQYYEPMDKANIINGTNNDYLNPNVVNMLNVKYSMKISENPNGVDINDEACGPVWFVRGFKAVNSRDEELLSLFNDEEIDTVQSLIKKKLAFDNEIAQLSDSYVKLYSKKKRTDEEEKQFRSLQYYLMQKQIEYDNFTKRLYSFDPKVTAIIHKEFESKLENFTFDSTATIELIQYKPNHLIYISKASADQLAVFSEIYYQPGWQAYIDGQPAEHFRVDYVLRGMMIPEGEHEIEFKFEPQSYFAARKISVAGSALIILLLIGGIFYSIRKNKGKEFKFLKNIE
jgi:hypothetical protein